MQCYESVILLILLCIPLFGDTIILKNGKKYEGKVVNQTREKVQIQLEDGKEILLNKQDIQKIQFGPTLEEVKKKEEEEWRKLEEAKRLEEERRKLEELRKEVFLSFGTGNSNHYLPLELITNIFNKQKMFISKLVFDNNSFFSLQGVKHFTTHFTLEVGYNYNLWSFGFTALLFDIIKLMNSAYGYSIESGINKNPPNNYFFDYEVSQKSNIDKNSKYGLYSFYGKYYYYKYNFLNSVSYVAIPFGILSRNINFNSTTFYNERSLFNTNFASGSFDFFKFHSNNKNTLFTGIAIENHFFNDFKWDINLLFYYGKFIFTQNITNFKIISSNDVRKTNFQSSGIQRGLEFGNRLEKSISSQLSLFFTLNLWETHYSMNSIDLDGFFFESKNQDLETLNFLTPLISELTRFVGDNKIIEINRVLSFGIKYKFFL